MDVNFEQIKNDAEKESSSALSQYNDKDLYDAILKSAVGLKDKYQAEQYILWFIENEGIKRGVMSLGNISVSIGGAKSRKTFFSTMIMAALLSENDEFAISGHLLGRKALFIDTEQSKKDAQKVLKRIATITGTDCSNIDVLSFREVPDMKMRLAMLEFHLEKNKGLYSFICVDGIVDLVTDFNNQEECRKVVAQIMAMSSKYNCHINNIIHTNKDKGHARGHLGAELMNKAETAFKIMKQDAGDSVVTCEASRGREFSEWDFNVDDNGLPKRLTHPIGYYDNLPKKQVEPQLEPNVSFEEGTPF